MERRRRKAWLRYKRESFRYGFYDRRLPLALLLNVVLVLFLGSFLLLILEIEKNPEIHNYGDAAWCMFVSMATIGYGDVVPVTTGGKLTVIISMIIGIGALSTYITSLATRRVAKTKRRYSGLQGKTKCSDHIVICGWNTRGPYVAERLKAELEKQYRPIVLLADLEDNPVEDDYLFFFRGSPANETDLRRVNIAEAGAVILLADECRSGSPEDIDSHTVLAALTIRALNPDLKMTAEVLMPENIGHLELAKVGEILDSNVVLGNLIARSALHYGLIGIVNELVAHNNELRIYPLPVEDDMAGKTNKELVSLFRERRGGKLIGVITSDGFKSYDQPYTVRKGDRLLIMAEEKPDMPVPGSG